MSESSFWSKQQHLDYLRALKSELEQLYRVQPDEAAGSAILALSELVGRLIANYRQYHLNEAQEAAK